MKRPIRLKSAPLVWSSVFPLRTFYALHWRQLRILKSLTLFQRPKSVRHATLTAKISIQHVSALLLLFLFILLILLLVPVRGECGVSGCSMSCQRIRHKRLSLLWEGVAFTLWLCCCCRTSGVEAAAAPGAAATASSTTSAGQSDDVAGTLSWLLSDKGPFHQSFEFTEASERYQQGYTTRYKIYR